MPRLRHQKITSYLGIVRGHLAGAAVVPATERFAFASLSQKLSRRLVPPTINMNKEMVSGIIFVNLFC